MNDLQLDLTGAADTFDLPPGDVASVVARGQARGRRRQRLVATTATLALVGTSVAGLRLVAGGDPTTTVAAGGMAMRLGDDTIAWEVVEGTSVLSLVQENSVTSSPSGRLYALSTAPGEADLGQAPRVVWQSDDGVDWSAAPLSDDIFLSDLATADDRIYAVGTGPATAAVAGDGAVPDLVVGWSDDGAQSWQTATLPIDMAAIAEVSRSVTTNPEELAIASTPDATVAVASVGSDLDVPRFLPEGASAPNGWAITPQGVDLLGPESRCPQGMVEEGDTSGPRRLWAVSCIDGDGEVVTLSPQEARGVTASVTWDELGVTGDVRRAALGQPLAFVAPAGTDDFEAVDLALDDLGGFGLSLHADADGFLLVRPTSTGAARVLASSDGRNWSEPADLPGGLSRVTAAGRVGDTFVVLGQGDTEGAMVVTEGGGGWQAVAVADLLGLEGDDVLVNLGGGAVEAQGVVAAVTTYEEGGDRVDHLVLTSGDAVTWSAQPVADLIEEPVATLGHPVIAGDRAVVPVAPIGKRGADGHLEQVALVATLP
jgi:hypothetical protein